jgi:hypothetical protein
VAHDCALQVEKLSREGHRSWADDVERRTPLFKRKHADGRILFSGEGNAVESVATPELTP